MHLHIPNISCLMKLRCIVIDDEMHAIEGLKSYFTALPQLELVQVYTDSLLALTEIKAGENVDLIFMDVDMPKISGIELSKAIRHKTDKLIFTTAHSKYAFDAYEINANAFLLKPFTLARFVETVTSFFSEIKLPAPALIKESEDYFFIRNKNDGNNLIKVRYHEIIAVESLQNYIRIYTTQESVITYMTISEIKVVLKDHPNFMQAHRSFIVSKNHIEKIDGNTLKLSNGLTVNIGSSYKDAVQAYITEKTIKSNRY